MYNVDTLGDSRDRVTIRRLPGMLQHELVQQR